MVNKIKLVDNYYYIEYRSHAGIETIVLTEHDLIRVQERAQKQGLVARPETVWYKIVFCFKYLLGS